MYTYIIFYRYGKGSELECVTWCGFPYHEIKRLEEGGAQVLRVVDSLERVWVRDSVGFSC